MKQWNAIRTLVQTLQGDTAVRSIFLKGSLARGDGDEYSDVDVYCLVHDHELESFLDRRLDHLRHYRDLLFWSEPNFVGPQIVAVYSNGLHLDLYTVTASTLHTTDAVKILYDPEGLLAGYKGSSFTLSKENILKAFDSLSFSLLEFESSFRRGNLVWASRLASHISGNWFFWCGMSMIRAMGSSVSRRSIKPSLKLSIKPSVMGSMVLAQPIYPMVYVRCLIWSRKQSRSFRTISQVQ